MNPLDQQLIEACKKGDIHTAQTLLQQGANPNAKDHYDFKTPFITAAENGHTPIIQLLTQHGADPSITDDFGENALYYAVKNQHYDTVQYLITQLHFDPNTQYGVGETVFMLAAKNGDIKMLKLLLQLGADPYTTGLRKRNALHHAVENHQYNTTQYLITQLQLDPNTQDHYGTTPFMIAAQNGDIKMFKLLLQLGANPYTTDRQGRTALHYAIKNHHYNTTQYLITQLGLNPNTQDEYGITPFILATIKDDIKILELLLQHGANPYATDHQGRTALHHAVEYRKYYTAKYLLTQLHLNPNTKDHKGITPFMIALENNDIHMLQLLLQHGADPNCHIDNSLYLRPIHITAKKGHTPIIQLLIQHGADPYTTDNNGKTALHYAIEYYQHGTARYLLTQLHLNPNTKDHKGITPFMIAIEKGDITMTQLLLQHGADPNSRTNDRPYPSAIHIAAKKGYTPIIQLLIQYGADPYATDNNGKTALHYALEYHQHDTAQYLLTKLHLNPNTKDNKGITPFLLAAENGDPKMLQLLIQHGANPYTTDHKGQNALHYAEKVSDNTETTNILIRLLHLNPNTQDHRGYTPLFAALLIEDYNTTQTLIQHGANPNIPNHKGQKTTNIAKRKRIPLRIPPPSTITL